MSGNNWCFSKIQHNNSKRNDVPQLRAPLLCYVRNLKNPKLVQENGFDLSGNTWAFSEIQHNISKRGMCLQVVHPSFHFQERRF